MADSALSGLTAATSVSTDDLMLITDDPGGTPASKKVTFDNVQGSLSKVGKVTMTQPATSATLTIPDGVTLTGPSASGTVATLAGSETLTNKTLTAPKFADGGFIADANGNEMLVFDTTAAAVNHFEMVNSAADGVHFHTAGDDANIAMHLKAKGTGKVSVEDSTDDTKLLRFDPSGNATGIKFTVASAATGSDKTATFPDVTGTVTVLGNTTTGSGSIVLATSPSLTTPTLGVASATSVNKVAITAPATGSTLTIADGKTLTANNSITLAGTDATTMTFPTTSASVARTDAAQTFTGVQSMTSPDITTSITTPSTTFSIANATATTLNIGGAATTMNIGGSGAAINIGGGATAAELRFMEPSGGGTSYAAIKAPALGASYTLTLPTTDGDASQVLTTDGSGVLSWSTASGLSWGSSISGTTADGITLTLDNSSNDGASALKIVAGNTQTNQPVLLNLQVGTSAQAMGLMIQGTGSGTSGAVGTGRNLMTIWGDTVGNTSKVSIGSEGTFTETVALYTSGKVALTPVAITGNMLAVTLPVSTAASATGLYIEANNTQTNAAALANLYMGTSGNVMGMMIKGTSSATVGALGTGKNHLTLWRSVADDGSDYQALEIGYGTSFTHSFGVYAGGQMAITPSTATTQVITITPTNMTRGVLICNGTVGSSAAVTNSISLFQLTPSYTGTMGGANISNDTFLVRVTRTSNGVETRSDNYNFANFTRKLTTNHASSNFTEAGSVGYFENSLTQTLGTITCTTPVIKLVQSSLSTGHPISITQNAVVSTNYRKVWTETNTGITIWMGNGTTANGTLSGTAGDILYNGGSNKPEYCTGTTNWTALV